MCRETTNGMNGRRHPYLLPPKANMPCAIDQGAAQRSPCLKSRDQDMSVTAPYIVFQMVFDATSGTHTAAGDNDGTGTNPV